jgi:hypothetical protein
MNGHRTRYALFLLGLATLWLATAQAMVPSTMNYQGFLSTTDGQPLDAMVVITFRLYDAPTDGALMWEETQTVDVVQGVFSVELGSAGSPQTEDLFDQALWLSIQVEADTEMQPRQRLTSVGFAQRSGKADTLQGATAAELDQSAHVGDTANPHGVTALQTGAASEGALVAHVGNVANPHGVTAVQTGAASEGALVALQADLAAALLSIATLQGDLAAANATMASLQDALAAETAARVAAVNGLAASVSAIETNSVLALDGKLTLTGATAQFTGVNVQVVDGSGATDGVVNGLGNLIVGYNETRGTGDDRTGSHNLVVGKENNYSSYGGIVGGRGNTISAVYASVSGGRNNAAIGSYASVSGGDFNNASGLRSSVSGGALNTASGADSSVSGGAGNTASGLRSSVSGGISNAAEGDRSLILTIA